MRRPIPSRSSANRAGARFFTFTLPLGWPTLVRRLRPALHARGSRAGRPGVVRRRRRRARLERLLLSLLSCKPIGGRDERVQRLMFNRKMVLLTLLLLA